MRAFIAERLAEIKEPGERVLLKQVLTDVFLPLYDETERKYAGLEQRVRNELPLLYDTYTVYSTVLPRERIDVMHAYLSPMIPEEANESVIDARSLAGDLAGGAHPTIETVFIEADYLECRKIVRDRRILDGLFTTSAGQYRFKCRMEPAKRYVDCVETLYNAFLRNDVPWTTVNGAYLNKFFDVKLVSMDEMPANAKIRSAEVSYSPYDAYVVRGMIPVWNVDTYRVKVDAFPEPAEDSINYEYIFETHKLGTENGYLIDFDSGFILSARREKDTFVIVSPQQQNFTWNLYRLRGRQDTEVDIYPYPILSNARRDTFSARLTLKYGTRIATPAAMRTLILSLEPSEFLEFADSHFAGDKLAGDTYDMNPFIRDEIRDPAHQKTLVMSFKAKKRDLFINRDLLSFMVSEFQAAYPEYRCVGTLA
ncbi:MAG: hypothetical protein LBH28_11105 [Oscillospiraceae bacterium]|jgi:hypothetical protein|nr:hypothetical protein [Oscillospiraceae bacterium]